VAHEQRTRVAVVGTGPWWGREHARVFTERPDVDLCGVVGSTPERAAARAREFRTTPYADLDEMLELNGTSGRILIEDTVQRSSHRQLVRDRNPGRRSCCAPQ
jgi:hypothetical protein